MRKKMNNPKKYLMALQSVLNNLDLQEFEDAIEVIKKHWKVGSKIIVCGNGGSALTALHYVTDWNKSISQYTNRPFKGFSLIDNVGLITAYANDMSYEDAFSQQLSVIGNEGDLLIVVTGSGNSENVVRAINYAKSNGIKTLGLVGFDGGKVKQKLDNFVHVVVDDMQISEDVHLIFGHMVMRALCS